MTFFINVLFFFDVMASVMLVLIHCERADRRRAAEARAKQEQYEILLRKYKNGP